MRRPADLETTSLGAAFAAGIGSGFWSQEWVLGSARQHQQDTVFQPQVVPLQLAVKLLSARCCVQLVPHTRLLFVRICGSLLAELP